MKKFLKFLTAVLVLCQLVGIFSACTTDKVDVNESEETQEESFVLTKEFLASYVIVTPRDTSEDITAVAKLLQRSIKDAYGITLEIRDDFIIEGTDDFCEAEYEILIGNTNRNECREYYANVKKNDYGYALVGKKLLILGYTNASANNSAIEFKLDILSRKADVVIKTEENKLVSGKYDYETLMLNGVDIKNYKIVYPAASVQGENEIAIYLRDYITAKTGYVIQCDNDTTGVSEYEIQVGETVRVTDEMRNDRAAAGYSNDHSYVGKTNNGVWLSGNNKNRLYVAMERLISNIDKVETKLALDISENSSAPMKELSLSVLTYNVYFDLSETKRNSDDVIVSIKQKSPDVFGLNESGKDWINKFNADRDISSVYACVEGKAAEKASDALYNPIFYRKDKFELVEWGTKWLSATPDKISMFGEAKHYKIFTYAILKNKETGVEFMYINVHLDGSNDGSAQAALEDVRKKQADVVKNFAESYSYLPIVMGGDFNEAPSSAVIRGIINSTRFKYGMTVAKTKVDIGTTKKVNSKFELLEKGSVIDYLFMTGDSITVNKYEQVDNIINDQYPSDHLPVYAEIGIRY